MLFHVFLSCAVVMLRFSRTEDTVIVGVGVTYNLTIVKSGRHEIDIVVNISSHAEAAMEGKLTP